MRVTGGGMHESRRQMIRRNHEPVQRAIAALAVMVDSFGNDIAAAMAGQSEEPIADLRNVQAQCADAVQTLVSMLTYAGISDDELLHMAEQIEREQSAL